jgi:TonB family protein
MWSVLAPRLGAQSALYVEHHNKLTLVRSAKAGRPYVEENGALVPASSRRFAVGKAEEYLPVFVAVRDLRIRTVAAESTDNGATFNNQFEFYGDFVSAYPLDDVFVLLDFTMPNGAKSYFLREIGSLEPNKPLWRRFQIAVGGPMADATYEFHLFVGGAEVLQSQQAADYREAVLARMVARRIKGRPDGPPARLTGPPPEYPPKLAPSKMTGRAVVRLRISAEGTVADPVVVSATDPAFGESAIAALRQWRFVPQIKGGQPVATTVELPFDFAL